MREIKFRAWDSFNRIMYNDNAKVVGSMYFYAEHQDVTNQNIYMQYTGLKDKNGREIYEGDIVEYNDFNSLRTGGHAEDRIIRGKVFFSCGMWMVDTNNSRHDLYEGLLNDEEFEIIGNIYEDPELLEAN